MLSTSNDELWVYISYTYQLIHIENGICDFITQKHNKKKKQNKIQTPFFVHET